MSRNLVAGVGINDADYKTQEYATINNKQVKIWICPFYQKWINMLKRCYSQEYGTETSTYKDCYVCEEWLYFSNFKSWMETQDWENKQLDKDLLVCNNKIYSPDTCVFIPKEVNIFLTKRNKCRGIYPLGVSYMVKSKTSIKERTNPFISTISENGKTTYLGYFNLPVEAHRAWQKAKIDLAEVLKKEQTDIRIISGLQRIINKIQYDYDNNLETIDF